jgi:hypothetical protein
MSFEWLLNRALKLNSNKKSSEKKYAVFKTSPFRSFLISLGGKGKGEAS